MTDFVRLLALAGVLFCIGIYGLLTRRTYSGAFIALGVILAAAVLVIVAGNNYIRPSDPSGYIFIVLLALIAVVYALLAAPFLVDEIKSAREEEAAEPQRNGAIDLLATAVSNSGSFPFQVSITVTFIIAVLLFRVTVIGFAAFLLGVFGLKAILASRLRNRRKEQSRVATDRAAETLSAVGSKQAGHLPPAESN